LAGRLTRQLTERMVGRMDGKVEVGRAVGMEVGKAVVCDTGRCLGRTESENSAGNSAVVGANIR
jgi:hypothetical protein